MDLQWFGTIPGMLITGGVLLLIIGFLFVYDFKIKKPNNREVGFIIVCAIIVIAGCILL